jgi:hypothetical protein
VKRIVIMIGVISVFLLLIGIGLVYPFTKVNESIHDYIDQFRENADAYGNRGWENVEARKPYRIVQTKFSITNPIYSMVSNDGIYGKNEEPEGDVTFDIGVYELSRDGLFSWKVDRVRVAKSNGYTFEELIEIVKKHDVYDLNGYWEGDLWVEDETLETYDPNFSIYRPQTEEEKHVEQEREEESSIRLKDILYNPSQTDFVSFYLSDNSSDEGATGNVESTSKQLENVFWTSTMNPDYTYSEPYISAVLWIDDTRLLYIPGCGEKMDADTYKFFNEVILYNSITNEETIVYSKTDEEYAFGLWFHEERIFYVSSKGVLEYDMSMNLIEEYIHNSEQINNGFANGWWFQEEAYTERGWIFDYQIPVTQLRIVDGILEGYYRTPNLVEQWYPLEEVEN